MQLNQHISLTSIATIALNILIAIYYLWCGCDGDFVTEPVYHGNPCGHTLKASDFVEKLSE